MGRAAVQLSLGDMNGSLSNPALIFAVGVCDELYRRCCRMTPLVTCTRFVWPRHQGQF